MDTGEKAAYPDRRNYDSEPTELKKPVVRYTRARDGKALESIRDVGERKLELEGRICGGGGGGGENVSNLIER